MIILVLRALARLVTLVLLVALALAGLAVAVFSIGGPDDPLGLGALAEYVRLPELEDEVGGWLGQLEEDGALARRSALGGLCAVTAGLLLVATVIPRRERLVVLERSEAGELRARRRPLAQAAEALAERERGVTAVKARVRPRRLRRGGRLHVRASRRRDVPAQEVRDTVSRALAPLASEFDVRPRVQSRLGEGGERVE